MRGNIAYLKRVATVRLSVNHLHNILVNRLTALVSVTPVIRRSHSILAHVKVLRVVDVSVRARLNAVQHLFVEKDTH